MPRFRKLLWMLSGMFIGFFVWSQYEIVEIGGFRNEEDDRPTANTTQTQKYEMPTSIGHQAAVFAYSDNLLIESLSSSNWVRPDERIYRKRSDLKTEFNSTLQFTFFMGLEGTGHHLLYSIGKASPALQYLKALGVWDNNTILELHRSLFWVRRKPSSLPGHGIWNAHCLKQKDAEFQYKTLVESMVNMERVAEENLVKHRNSILNQSSSFMPPLQQQQQRPFPVPVNTVALHPHYDTGMISYPNFGGKCRRLAYPDISLWYEACQEARVDCVTVAIFRDPLDILHSVVRRGFDTNDTSTIQLFLTQLHVMTNQIQMYPEKVFGCLELFQSIHDDILKSSHNKNRNNDFVSTSPPWMQAQPDIWTFTNESNFREQMQRAYRPPKSMQQKYDDEMKRNMNNTSKGNFTKDQTFQKWKSHEERVKEWIHSSQDGPYIASWARLHQHALNTCRLAISQHTQQI